MGEDRGQRDAGTVYRQLAPAVLGYLRGQGVPDPEDLLGETFLQVARDIHRVKGDALDVRRWVFRVARNRVIDDARRRDRRPARSGETAAEQAGADVAPPFDRDLLAALDALTPDQREVVVLRFVADLSLDAVADLTGRPVGAVKSLQHRGLAHLAQAVSPEDPASL